jgi:hypothetical protein
MQNIYQFSHIFAYYNWQKRLAYSFNRIELGDAYERYETIYFNMSCKEG